MPDPSPTSGNDNVESASVPMADMEDISVIPAIVTGVPRALIWGLPLVGLAGLVVWGSGLRFANERLDEPAWIVFTLIPAGSALVFSAYRARFGNPTAVAMIGALLLSAGMGLLGLGLLFGGHTVVDRLSVKGGELVAYRSGSALDANTVTIEYREDLMPGVVRVHVMDGSQEAASRAAFRVRRGTVLVDIYPDAKYAHVVRHRIPVRP